MGHLLITVAVGVIIYLLSAAPKWQDYFLGSFLAGANLLLILWVLKRSVLKKSFALTAAASVFKYGFLIFLFWLASKVGRQIGYEFLLGILLILPTTLLITYELAAAEKDKKINDAF